MEAIRLSPQNPDFIALMSGIELDLSRPRSALKWAEQGLAVKADHVRCANLRAKALSRLGKHKEAKETVKGALALDPESAQTHATSGWTLLQANEPEQALAHFQETVRLNPNDERAVYGLQRAKRATRWLGSPITRRTILVIAVANMCRLMVTEQDKSSGFIVLGTPVVVLVLWAPAKRLWVRYNGR
jgi:tetratricopeptide (TPR) repeat protein